jgi:hypothetical protein
MLAKLEARLKEQASGETLARARSKQGPLPWLHALMDKVAKGEWAKQIAN